MIDKKSIKKRIRLGYHELRRTVDQKLGYRAAAQLEASLLLLGKQMSRRVAAMPANADFRDVGFKVFSQWDEDGLIQYLISKIPIEEKTFIEFGVENYEESNTGFFSSTITGREWFLMPANPTSATSKPTGSTGCLTCRPGARGSRAKTLMPCLRARDFQRIWACFPSTLTETNTGSGRPSNRCGRGSLSSSTTACLALALISIPYQEDFSRSGAHHSNLYYGCSIAALGHPQQRKRVTCFWVRTCGDTTLFLCAPTSPEEFRGRTPSEAYVVSRFRESRGPDGRPTYVRGVNGPHPVDRAFARSSTSRPAKRVR